ncbi:MAG: ABC transporter permease, partial [Planctomycetota bacterium]
MSEKIISHQVSLPLSKAFELAKKSLKKRMIRSTITMMSVVLAIAFLMNILTNSYIIEGLRGLNSSEINTLLMKNGVDLAATGMSSKTIWLVVMSLLVCSVGIVNAMLMSVTERFQEIGTMKCLGAMDGFIIKIFMIEAFIQGA